MARIYGWGSKGKIFLLLLVVGVLLLGVQPNTPSATHIVQTLLPHAMDTGFDWEGMPPVMHNREDCRQLVQDTRSLDKFWQQTFIKLLYRFFKKHNTTAWLVNGNLIQAMRMGVVHLEADRDIDIMIQHPDPWKRAEHFLQLMTEEYNFTCKSYGTRPWISCQGLEEYLTGTLNMSFDNIHARTQHRAEAQLHFYSDTAWSDVNEKNLTLWPWGRYPRNVLYPLRTCLMGGDPWPCPAEPTVLLINSKEVYADSCLWVPNDWNGGTTVGQRELREIRKRMQLLEDCGFASHETDLRNNYNFSVASLSRNPRGDKLGFTEATLHKLRNHCSYVDI